MPDEAKPVQRQRAALPDKEALDRRRFSLRINPVCLAENPFRYLLRRNRRNGYCRITVDIGVAYSLHNKTFYSLTCPFTAGLGGESASRSDSAGSGASISKSHVGCH